MVLVAAAYCSLLQQQCCGVQLLAEDGVLKCGLQWWSYSSSLKQSFFVCLGSSRLSNASFSLTFVCCCVCVANRGKVIVTAAKQVAKWTLPSFICRDNLGKCCAVLCCRVPCRAMLCAVR